MDNPYEPPDDKGTAADNAPVTRTAVACEFSDDTKGNLSLTSTLTRIVGVTAVLASASEFWQVVEATRSGSLSSPFSAWQLIIGMSCLLAPCWLFLAWMLWRYSGSLELWRRNGVSRTEATIEVQAKLWLAIGLVAFFIVLRAIILRSL